MESRRQKKQTTNSPIIKVFPEKNLLKKLLAPGQYGTHYLLALSKTFNFQALKKHDFEAL